MLLNKIKEAVHGRIGRRTVQSVVVVLCSKFMTLTFKVVICGKYKNLNKITKI